jgi:hypothetical protein
VIHKSLGDSCGTIAGMVMQKGSMLPKGHSKFPRDSLPIDMLLSALSVLVVAQPLSQFPESIMNHPVYLMFVPCIIKRSRKNQHNAQICTTALFHMLDPTCLPSLIYVPRFYPRIFYHMLYIIHVSPYFNSLYSL